MSPKPSFLLHPNIRKAHKGSIDSVIPILLS
jgi:hypothetical protein